jgi:hypothetical protein
MKFVDRHGQYLWNTTTKTAVKVQVSNEGEYVTYFQAFFDILDVYYYINPLKSGEKIKEGSEEVHVYIQTIDKWQERLRTFAQISGIVKEVITKENIEFKEIPDDSEQAKNKLTGIWVRKIAEIGAVVATPFASYYLLKYFEDPHMRKMINDIHEMADIANPSLKVRLHEVEDEANRAREEAQTRRV